VAYAGGFGGGAPAETLAMAQWASADRCTIGPVVTAYDTKTNVKTWTKANSPVEVVLYTTQDGGHAWPPAHVPANAIIWNFFNRHSLQEGGTTVAIPAVAARAGSRAPAVRTEFFNLAGRPLASHNGKVNASVKRIVVARRIMANGQVVTERMVQVR
jgi:hypothetical protein